MKNSIEMLLLKCQKGVVSQVNYSYLSIILYSPVQRQQSSFCNEAAFLCNKKRFSLKLG